MVRVAALFIVLTGIATSVQASTIVVNFDDLTGFGTVADGYGGITWNGEWDYYDSAQFPYTPSSDFTRVYNNDRLNPSTFNFTTAVVFDGAWFSGLDSVDSPNDNPINFELYLGGILQATSSSLFATSVPAFLSSGYIGLVDEVRVISGTGDYYVMDDVTYETSAVPEPASLALVGLGAFGLIANGLRRRKLHTAS